MNQSEFDVTLGSKKHGKSCTYVFHLIVFKEKAIPRLPFQSLRNRKWTISKIYKGDHKTSDLKMSNTYNLSMSDEATTDTEEAAIAILAIHGFMTTPRGSNAPAANGIPIML